MNAPAAIQAQLVDVRNVSSHKCVRLEIHVPAEQAGDVMAAFGWPTMADPVPVALARLVENISPANRHEEFPKGERRSFTDLPLSQQAALRCAEPDFYKFMCTKFRPDAIIPYDPRRDEKAAPSVPMLRHHLGIGSRRDLDLIDEKGKAWLALDAEYYAWQRGMR
jgi:hypothetical protein